VLHAVGRLQTCGLSAFELHWALTGLMPRRQAGPAQLVRAAHCLVPLRLACWQHQAGRRPQVLLPPLLTAEQQRVRALQQWERRLARPAGKLCLATRL
jgi:hypothetical protein